MNHALKAFYQDSKFHEWYESTAEIRAQALDAFTKVRVMIDLEWFDSFFEKREDAQFQLILSIFVGPCNYGCNAGKKDGTRFITPVIGCCTANSEGETGYSFESVFPVVIHEFCHSYCNPLVDNHWDGMKKKADRVFKPNRKILYEQAYNNSETMMCETFVRSCVIRYMATHFEDTDEKALIKDEEERGFVLTGTIADLMKERERKNGEYPTMSSFMPRILEGINDFRVFRYLVSRKMETFRRVRFSCSLEDGATDVPAGEYEVHITFQKPMKPSIALGYSAKGYEFPECKSHFWNEDGTVQTLILIFQPDTDYGFTIRDGDYMSTDGHRGLGKRPINFHTAK